MVIVGGGGAVMDGEYETGDYVIQQSVTYYTPSTAVTLIKP